MNRYDKLTTFELKCMAHGLMDEHFSATRDGKREAHRFLRKRMELPLGKGHISKLTREEIIRFIEILLAREYDAIMEVRETPEILFKGNCIIKT